MSAPPPVTPLSPVIRKSKITKRSSNSYSSEEWKRHRPLITRLYFEEGKTLKEVREVMEKEYRFFPTERMYKSRLHTWGLDKKKKEHEMLDLVRQGLAQGANERDKVFVVRGRQITLADALHYFNRKGIKDPTTLLESDVQLPGDSESADEAEADAETPPSTSADMMDPFEASETEYRGTDFVAQHPTPSIPGMKPTLGFADHQMRKLQHQLGIQELKPLPPFRSLSIEASIQQYQPSSEEQRYLDAVFTQTKEHYRRIFASRQLAVNTSEWNATSDDALADKFYYSMYHGYNFLWNGQRDTGFQNFYHAFDMIEQLLRDNHVGFMIYVMDLIIRHDGTGYEEPLILLLQHVADMAKLVYGSEDNPVFLLALWFKSCGISRSWLAEATLRKLLDFFQDSIGYFHPETIALLQTYAFGLMNRKRYKEAALRFQQLVDAFETTQGRDSYEVCYALRSASEAFFQQEDYPAALQALQAALLRSPSLPRHEEREIHVRCLRAMAEISNKLARHDDANETMQQVVECCVQAFGPEHPYTDRARMHKKSLRKGESETESAIPPMVYRLGRGGNAAKYIWTTRSSPTRLQA